MSDSLASFESQLQEVLQKKPPISASTTSELTKLATLIPADGVGKLVARVEKFFQTSPKPYRLSALYLLDSICKAKSEVRKLYVEQFSTRLPALMAIFLKDSSEKDQESAKKLGRIWLEKRLFTDRTMYYVSRSFKNEINYTLPGSEQLKDPGNSEKDNSTNPLPLPTTSLSSHQLPPNPHLAPYPGMAPPMAYAPGPISTHTPPPMPASNLVDDLSKLGDLNALLGVAPAPPAVDAFQPRQTPIDPRFVPQDRPYPYTDASYAGDRRPMGDMSMPPASDGRYGGQNDFRDGASRPGQRRPYDRQNQGNRNGAPGNEPREGFRDAEPETSGPLYSDNLFVGSLPTDMGESDLRDMFGKFGHLRRVTVKGDKGFAFVAFGRRADAELAKASLDGTQVLGKTLRIKWARSDKYREATVDPDTGLLSFGGAAASSSSSDNASSQPNSNSGSYQARTHGLPRGVRPQYESSFADGDVSYNNGGPRDYDQNKGKRRYEGDQPQADKRRQENNDGFQSLTSWSSND